jgi:hypothetical protein
MELVLIVGFICFLLGFGSAVGLYFVEKNNKKTIIGITTGVTNAAAVATKAVSDVSAAAAKGP